MSGRLRIVGSGTNRVDTTRVENASRAHVLALEALKRPSAVNRAYFISQGEPVDLWPWVNSILAALEIPSLQKKIPFGAAYELGRLCEWIWMLSRRRSIPPMTRFVATELSKSHWFSIEAARKELGYRPEEYPTAEGIAAYVEAWKSGTTPRN
jgi:nucleoside-diphosphate-sugar epimerase